MTTETVTVDAGTNNQAVNDALRNGTNGTTQTATPQTTGTNGQQQANQPESFDKWIAAQPDGIKDLFDDHVDGLKSALEDERRERKGLAARLKELGKQADVGSELQKQLESLTGQMTEADTKASFYEGAHEAGVKNLRLAWIAAKEYDLINKGKVDFVQLKQLAPELFGVAKAAPPAGNAGNGAGQAGIQQPDMNRAIRAMAGRSV